MQLRPWVMKLMPCQPIDLLLLGALKHFGSIFVICVWSLLCSALCREVATSPAAWAVVSVSRCVVPPNMSAVSHLGPLQDRWGSPSTNKKTPRLTKTATPTTAPTPIPALAPVDKELDVPVAFDAAALAEAGPVSAPLAAVPPCEDEVADPGTIPVELDVVELTVED